jgi:DMSO/TMAO reductase YedYZ heme-binding membrane subunit
MWIGKNIFPRLSEVTALILFVTSNNFSQKLLGKNWKRIQKLAYVYFLSG